MAFAGSQGVKGLSGGKFHVDAHAVSKVTNLFDDFRGGSGDGLGMDITAEMVLGAQQIEASVHEFHSVGWIFYYTGA